MSAQARTLIPFDSCKLCDCFVQLVNFSRVCVLLLLEFTSTQLTVVMAMDQRFAVARKCGEAGPEPAHMATSGHSLPTWDGAVAVCRRRATELAAG